MVTVHRKAGGLSQKGSEGERTLLDFAVSNSSAIFYIASREGQRPVRFISGNIERLTGHRPVDFIDDETFGRKLIHEEDRQHYERAVQRLSEEQPQRVEYRLATAWGSSLWFREELRQLPAEDRNERRFVGCMVDITAEKTAEAQLHEAVGLVQALVGNALDAVIAIDDGGAVVEFNPAAERMFGFSRDEALGVSLADLVIPPESRALHQAGIDRLRSNPKSVVSNRRLQLEAQRKDGSRLPVELTIASVDVGDKRLFVGEVRDLSERLAAQSEQARLMRLLEDSITSLPAAFCLTDTDDRILLCNKRFARMLGREPRELVGMHRSEGVEQMIPWLVRFDGEPVDPLTVDHDAIVRRLGAAEIEPVELELKNGQHHLIWSKRTEGGQVINVRTDVTPLKRAEQQIRQMNELIHKVLDACPVPVGMTRAEDGAIIYESLASKSLYLRGDADNEQTAVDNYVDPEDRRRYLKLLRRAGRIDGFEVLMRRGDGTEFWAAISARLAEFRGEEVIVSSTFDLTEMRRVDDELTRQREALHQGEKLAALGELLAGVAHELNNPLSILVGQAMLLQETVKDPKIAERARKIGNAADRCARIVKAFLSMARQQPMQREAVPLDELIDATLEVTGYTLRSSNVAVTIRRGSDLPPAWGDPNQLTQVLTNLVINAQQALGERKEGRSLTISSGYRGSRGELYIKIKDNGPGVRSELKRRIFEPFFTTKEVGAGTGIGLAFCHRVLEAHGGRIKVDDAPDGGAVFQIVLPVAPENRPIETTPDEGARRDQVRRRALVVEDEEDIAEVMGELLDARGFETDFAYSGNEALSCLANKHYDIILSDLRMPELDGCRLLEVLNERRPELVERLAFVTGDGMSPKAQAFLTASGRPYLEKPVQPDELDGLLDRLRESITA